MMKVWNRRKNFWWFNSPLKHFAYNGEPNREFKNLDEITSWINGELVDDPKKIIIKVVV